MGESHCIRPPRWANPSAGISEDSWHRDSGILRFSRVLAKSPPVPAVSLGNLSFQKAERSRWHEWLPCHSWRSVKTKRQASIWALQSLRGRCSLEHGSCCCPEASCRPQNGPHGKSPKTCYSCPGWPSRPSQALTLGHHLGETAAGSEWRPWAETVESGFSMCGP